MRKAILALALLTYGCVPAYAQEPQAPSAPLTHARVCGDRTEMLKNLQQKYGETAHSIALSNAGGVLEVFTNPETGSWTILITNPGRPTCVAGAGKGWEDAAKGSQDPTA